MKFYEEDITSARIEEIFQQENITHVIHQAAQIDVEKSFKNPEFDMENNIMGTLNILQCCIKYEVEKIIYASSAAVYGEPDYLPIDEKHPVNSISPYGISKHTPEHYIEMYSKHYNLNYTILRYSNVYGPRQGAGGEGGVISIFVDRMLSNQIPIIFGDGEQTRDFIYVEDVVNGNVKALSNANGKILNLSTGNRKTVNEIWKNINELLNRNIQPKYRKEKEGDIKHSVLNNQEAIEHLNWEPEFSLYDGLKRSISYKAKKKGIEEVAVTIKE